MSFAKMIETLPKVRGTLTPDRPMADLSWLRVGGPAEVLFQPADTDDLRSFLADLPADIKMVSVAQLALRQTQFSHPAMLAQPPRLVSPHISPGP